jgi:hypothetical protein
MDVRVVLWHVTDGGFDSVAHLERLLDDFGAWLERAQALLTEVEELRPFGSPLGTAEVTAVAHADQNGFAGDQSVN